MKVTWWGGPDDGISLEVPPDTRSVVVAVRVPFDWRTDADSPAESMLRTRTFPISESYDGRLWLVWTER